MVAALANSKAKSRDETASSAFGIGLSKPSNLAVRCLSIGKEVPASAAAPRGDSLIRFLQSWNLSRSLPIISIYAAR